LPRRVSGNAENKHLSIAFCCSQPRKVRYRLKKKNVEMRAKSLMDFINEEVPGFIEKTTIGAAMMQRLISDKFIIKFYKSIMTQSRHMTEMHIEKESNERFRK
jgi:hypothetical protein